MLDLNIQSTTDNPALLVVAGHDPTGGAGIQADIQTAAALGVHALTVISCLTVQDTRNVHKLSPVDSQLVQEQLEILLSDIPVSCCKLGLLGSNETVEIVASQLQERDINKLILDPVLAAGGGTELAGEKLRQSMRDLLIPRTTLITPNLPEAQKLTGKVKAEDCATELTAMGSEYVLITGGHNDEQEVVNRLFSADGLINEWNWPRLPHDYHGSGCTLASAAASLIAKRVDVHTAVNQAQKFSWHALSDAMSLGQAQLIPKRFQPA